MRIKPSLKQTFFVLLVSGELLLISACGGSKMEACKFVEIEDAEFEVEFGDIDAEGGEVEMVCGDSIVDVAWGEFRSKLRVDPGRYKQNLEAFKREVNCIKDEGSGEKKVFCSRPGVDDDYAALNYSDDD